MRPILEVQSISKKFLINHQTAPYLSFRDKISTLFNASGGTEEFWALNDLSFSVQEGESLGIIGHNGAGKSTLLKILSRITPPTKGKIIARGRIASLLEVGTGFHQELTGRENIFMNGSILGMKNAEIKNQFDAIVDFSGTEKFLDTPIKHYSSGMQLRLAFAVAAHLNPEILIVDEVLAVGDAEFQKKCLKKMEDVTGEGRTILFVSHNMNMISQLCSKSILLESGKIKTIGDTETVLKAYLVKELNDSDTVTHDLGADVRINNLRITENPIRSLSDTVISFEVTSLRPISINSLGFYINNIFQERVGILDLRKNGYLLNGDASLSFRVQLKTIPLIEGEYNIGLFIGSNLVSGNFDNLLRLQVQSQIKQGDVLSYPLEVRGKMEFDYTFHHEAN